MNFCPEFVTSASSSSSWMTPCWIRLVLPMAGGWDCLFKELPVLDQTKEIPWLYSLLNLFIPCCLCAFTPMGFFVDAECLAWLHSNITSVPLSKAAGTGCSKRFKSPSIFLLQPVSSLPRWFPFPFLKVSLKPSGFQEESFKLCTVKSRCHYNAIYLSFA